MWFSRNLFMCIVICQGIQLVLINNDDKTVYVVHYRQGRNIIPVTVEIDYEQKTEYVFNLSPKSSGKSIAFYDFREGVVAYKYLSSKQCFISHFSEETLENGSTVLKKLENKVVNDSSLVTLWASNRVLPPKLLLRLAGKRVAEFCKSAASFLVTSSENDEPFKLRKKRDTANEDKQQKGQFTHRSYGHYGHQSHNYAHYGHETYTGGQISSSGESVQKTGQYQTRRDGPSAVPSTGTSQPFLPFGSNGFVGGSSSGSSEGFALRTGYGGGYQINQPLGLRAGSQHRGALNTPGQYATNSRISPPGISTTFPETPGLTPRGEMPARIPGMSRGLRTGATTPGIPTVPSTRPVDETLSYQETRNFRKDARPGFLSPGIVSSSEPSVAARQPGLPGYPATTVTHPGLSLDTAQPRYDVRKQQPCCQQKPEGLASVSPDVPRIPATPGILQTGYVPSRIGTAQQGYPAIGISQELHPQNGMKPSDYRPPLTAGPGYPSLEMLPPAYPHPGILASHHRIPQIAHPGLLPPHVLKTDDSLSAAAPGQGPCCQPKTQQPGIATTDTGILSTRDLRMQPDYPKPVSPRSDYPSAVIAPPGFPRPTIIQPSHPATGLLPCCQPKVQPPGVVPAAVDIPSVRDARLQPGYTETSAARFDHRPPGTPQPGYPYPAVLQPAYPPSRITSRDYKFPTVEQPGYITQVAAQPSQAFPVIPEQYRPSPHTIKQIYPITPSRPGSPSCCQPKVQPESTFIGVPSFPGTDHTEIRRPDYSHPGWRYPDYPPSTRLPQPDHLPSSIYQPAYPSPVAPQPRFPSRDIDAKTMHPGYPLYPGQQQLEHRPYAPLTDTPHPAYPSLDPLRQIYPAPDTPQPSVRLSVPSTGIIPHVSIPPDSQLGYPSSRTVYPVQPGYPIHTRRTAPDYQPPETSGTRVAQPEHLLPGTPGTYSPGTTSVRTFLPGRSTHPVTGEAISTPGKIEHSRNGLISAHSKDDTAVSQTQVQTGYEGTAAEATSIGRHGGLGAQTQVQGGYTGNGSFSAQAQSGFTGGVTQSQVRGGKQGGTSGSSAQVERVGSAQSQVQVGRPSGAATGTAQGRFLSGVTQVQTQSGKRGGSAGAQAQSMGTSSSQVQVNVADSEDQAENGFQGGVSASVSGGHFGGQAHTQLQGGYDSGRTYVATAQGGFDSTSEFRGSVPGIGTIPGMLVRPLNGRLQPPTGAAGAEYMQPSFTGVRGMPQDHIPRQPDHLRFRPSEADRVYHGDYRFLNGSIRIPVNGIRDQTAITGVTDESRRLYIPSLSQHPTGAMTGIPGAIDTSTPGQQTQLRYPGLNESARRSSAIPAFPSTQRIPVESSYPVKLNGIHEPVAFQPAHPGFMPTGPFAHSLPSPSGQRLDAEIPRSEGIPVSAAPQPSTTIPGRSELPEIMPIPVDFPGQRGTQNGHAPVRADGRQLVPDLLHPDRTTQTHRVWPSHPAAQFPFDQQQVRPSQETSRPSPRVVLTTMQPVDSSVPTESRNISRDARLHLPSVPQHTSFPTTRGDPTPDCCKPKRDWRTRCCQSLLQQNGAKPQCCSGKYPDGDDEKYRDGDSDFDDGGEDTKDSCRIVKAVCYIVYKPSGRARVCKPTGTRGCT